MQKPIYACIVAALLVAGCGSSTPDSTSPTSTNTSQPAASSAKPEDQLAGTWKVDMAASKLEGMTDSEKTEGESLRTEIKPDGTFHVKSTKSDTSGTWKLDGHSVAFTGGDNQMPPTMTLSDDGSKLSYSMTEGGKEASIVMVKA